MHSASSHKTTLTINALHAILVAPSTKPNIESVHLPLMTYGFEALDPLIIYEP